MSFGSNTSAFFQKQIELPFFNHFLSGKGEQQLPEASVFETGTNRWRKFDAWPPTGTEKVAFYFHPKGRLAVEKPAQPGDAARQLSERSEPARALHEHGRRRHGQNLHGRGSTIRLTQARCAGLPISGFAKQPDAGRTAQAELFVSTTGTDSDWIVKLIDVQPGGKQI